MDLRLRGRRALVTGASRGIGLATVRALLDEGMHVVAIARTTPDELAASGARTVRADLGTADGPRAAVEAALAALGEIDVLVNNVGGGDTLDVRTFDETTDQDWHLLFELNLMAAVRTIRAALPSLRRTRGTIVSVSSDGALTPRQGALATPMPYPAAKAALNVVTKALSVELAPQGVRATTVSPGATMTSLWTGDVGHRVAETVGVEHADLLDALPEQAGLLTRRWIDADEIAAAIAFTASPLSASTVGANLVVDGGAKRAL